MDIIIKKDCLYSGSFKIKEEFQKISRFDRWLLRFMETRREVFGLIGYEAKKNPIVPIIFFVVPPPFGTPAITPFLLWYAFAPTKRMKTFRRNLSDAFNRELNHDRFGPFFDQLPCGTRKFIRGRALGHFRREMVYDMKVATNKSLNFFRKHLKRPLKQMKQQKPILV